jgi:hypothetical protein
MMSAVGRERPYGDAFAVAVIASYTTLQMVARTSCEVAASMSMRASGIFMRS